jgi:hypothetical protein
MSAFLRVNVRYNGRMDHFAHLKSRGLLCLSGADAADFLQGVVTADVTKLMPNHSLYAAHLNPQGKFLFDFLVYKLNDLILLDCPNENIMPLAQALHKYSVGRAVEFHDLRDDYALYASFNGTVPDGAALAVADPRHAQLPKRVIMPIGAAGTVSGMALVSEQEYEKLRLELGIPEGKVDAFTGKTLPAELGLDFLNAVSFNKGCYVGQELTTRMKHRTTPKTRLFKVALTHSANTTLEPGTPLTTEQGVEAGYLMSNDGKSGLALLKLRVLEKAKELHGNGFKVANYRLPSWVKS